MFCSPDHPRMRNLLIYLEAGRWRKAWWPNCSNLGLPTVQCQVVQARKTLCKMLSEGQLSWLTTCLTHLKRFGWRKAAPSILQSRISFSLTNGKRLLPQAIFIQALNPSHLKLLPFRNSMHCPEKYHCSDLFFPIWINCVPFPGAKVGHLGCKDPEKRVPGIGFHHITSLYNGGVEQKKSL